MNSNVHPSRSPLVTVVINCYNGEQFVREAIESVYRQTWPNWEIVFWDNASVDDTAAIARSFDERLRYFRADVNTPLGEARNRAFAQAQGDFVAMLDSDDVFLPDALEELVRGIEEGPEPYAVCYGGVEMMNIAGQTLSHWGAVPASGDLFGQLLRRFMIMPSASLVRRSVLLRREHQFDRTLSTSEDYCFFMTLAVDEPFRSLGRTVARYRIHEGALTNRTIGKWANEWEYTLSKIRDSHPGIESKYGRAFRHAFARVDYYRARDFMHTGRVAETRPLLRRNIFVDFRYFILYLLSFLPVSIWNAVHAWYFKRSHFT